MVTLTLGDNTVDLDDWTEGFVVTGVDIGPPGPRTVAYDLPGQDGDADLTRLVGSRAITVTLSILEWPHTRQECVDRLAPFLHPRARPVLDLATDDGPVRRVTVRSSPSSQQWQRPGHLELSVGFKTVGSPYFLGEPRQMVAGPVQSIQGRTYPLVHDRTYPATSDTTVTLFNGGTEDAVWSAEIVGPADGVRIETDLGVVSMPGLVLAPGEVARIDPPKVTVSGVTQFGAVDITGTTWFHLPPGFTSLLFHAGSYDPYTAATFTWSDTYL